MPVRRRAFTLIELLVVVAIIGILVSLILPAMGKARQSSKGLQCLNNFRQLALGWHMYADDNKDVMVPGRAPNLAGGLNNPNNWYDVGNGVGYRPTWIVRLGAYVGIYAFAEPDRRDDRKDFDSPVYTCPVVKDWNDERNSSYGYNFQFLGNSRVSASGSFIHFPKKRSLVQTFAGTAMAMDGLGTAAGVPESERKPYDNNGRDEHALGNEGFNLDPPRLTSQSDITSDVRSGPDWRHMGRVNVVMTDSHVETFTLDKLGYKEEDGGALVTYGAKDDAAGPHNRYFSGTGVDDDPPVIPD